ncbi:MAG: NAD(P)-dependent oxidoreductase [Bryobacterales bacterium]|nr:NAD(P)-dependent oxidoreductase [Bryobacterales bacterium]
MPSTSSVQPPSTPPALDPQPSPPPDVRGARVLITGSEGLIGRAVAEACVPSATVIGLDLERKPGGPGGVHFVPCDLTSDDSVERALDQIRGRHGRQIDSVIHLAGHYDFSGEPSHLYRDLTVEGTRRLLQGLRSFDVGQFQFSSTHIVMKPSEHGEPVTEQSEIDPAWAYPKSKVEAERVIAAEHGPIPVVILRIAGVYDENCHAVPLAQQIDRIFTKKLESYVFPGDASHGQAFVHLDDLVDVVLRAIARRRELGAYEVFLVAEPELESYEELQDQLGELIHGEEWPTSHPESVGQGRGLGGREAGIGRGGKAVHQALDDRLGR